VVLAGNQQTYKDEKIRSIYTEVYVAMGKLRRGEQSNTYRKKIKTGCAEQQRLTEES